MVGSKVYTAKVSSDEDKMELGKLAGKMAKVTGDNVMVKSVAMGMGEEGVAISVAPRRAHSTGARLADERCPCSDASRS